MHVTMKVYMHVIVSIIARDLPVPSSGLTKQSAAPAPLLVLPIPAIRDSWYYEILLLTLQITTVHS